MSKFYLGLRYLPYPFSFKVVGNLAFLKDFRDTQIKLFYLLLFKYVICPLPTVSVPYCFTDLHHRLTFFFFWNAGAINCLHLIEWFVTVVHFSLTAKWCVLIKNLKYVYKK